MPCQNLGKIDRLIRSTIGLGAIGAGIYFKSAWGFLGVVPLLSAAVGMCPLYMLCGGLSTVGHEGGCGSGICHKQNAETVEK